MKKGQKGQKRQKGQKGRKMRNMNDRFNNHLKTNYIYYLSYSICAYIISYYTGTSLIWCMLTAIITANISYFIHMLFHKVNFSKLYKKINKGTNIYTSNATLNTILKNLCKLINFHDKIHHDSNINKTNKNKIYEFLLNNFFSAFILIFLKYILEKCSYYILLY